VVPGALCIDRYQLGSGREPRARLASPLQRTEQRPLAVRPARRSAEPARRSDDWVSAVLDTRARGGVRGRAAGGNAAASSSACSDIATGAECVGRLGDLLEDAQRSLIPVAAKYLVHP
jgi:hypothetical protein